MPFWILAEVPAAGSGAGRIWLVFLVVAGAGALLSRRRWWLGLLVLPVIAILSIVVIADLDDPTTGELLRQTRGPAFAAHCRLAITVGFLVPVAAAIRARLRRKAPLPLTDTVPPT
jgi:hypothetical protein